MIKENMKLIIPIKLQFFSEGDVGTVVGINNNNETGTGSNNEIENGQGTHKGVVSEFDEFLKNPKNQSEFDKKIAKALNTAKAKWNLETQRKLIHVKIKAEKLAKLNADQQVEYERQIQYAELQKREEELNTRELKVLAHETLISKNLPKELLDILCLDNVESCNKSIEIVEKAFKNALDKAVNQRLRGYQND